MKYTERFLVIKESDITNYLNKAEVDALEAIVTQINTQRIQSGKTILGGYITKGSECTEDIDKMTCAMIASNIKDKD